MEKKYGQIDLYVHKQLGLPVRVSTTEKAKHVELTADFPAKTIELNQGLPESALNLPELKDYQVDTVPPGDSGQR